MVHGTAIKIKRASWAADRSQLEPVRRAVFVEEQGVPAEIEMDGQDGDCRHLLALLGEEVVGTVRLLPDGRIGRLAVLKDYRGRGYGRELILAMLQVARDAALPQVYLHAQCHALGFYTELGFTPEGDEFEEAGIDHINMILPLGNR